MAFMGIFALSIFLMMFIIIVACVIIFVFVPCLIIFIINLVKGITNKWPKRNLITTIVTGIILTGIIIAAAALMVFVGMFKATSDVVEGAASSEAAIALQYLLSQI